MSARRLFWLVDAESGEVLRELFSFSPRDAAMKAATRSERDIFLVEPAAGKTHAFRGEQVALTPEEENEFTRRYGISNKPKVTKMAYKNFGKPISRLELLDVCRRFYGVS